MITMVNRIVMASLMIALPMLISCGNVQKQVTPRVTNNNGRVTLECVVPFDDIKKNEAFQNFEKDIKSTFPDYNIHMNFVKGDAKAYNTKIKVMLYSDMPPDIFYSGDGKFTNELSSAKRIQPLEKKLNDINYWDMAIPGAKVIGDTGHIYAVPIDEAYYNVMLINTKMFSENNIKVPENFAELKNAVKQFNENSITPIAVGGKDGRAVYNMIEGFASTLDHEITSKIIRGDDTFSGKSFRQGATSVTQLIQLDAFEKKIQSISDEEAGELFYSSEAAFYCTSSVNLRKANDQLNGNVAVLYYPALARIDGSFSKNIVSGGIKKDSGLLISSLTNYPAEAAKIAVKMSKYYNKYLYEQQGDGGIIYKLNSLAWNRSIAKGPEISELTRILKQKSNVNTGIFEANISPDKEKSIEEASAAFMTGLLSVNDYLEQMDITMKSK